MKRTLTFGAAALLLASALCTTTVAADHVEGQPIAIRRDSAATRHRTTRVDGGGHLLS
jgi:hypothetical protein